MSCLGSGRNSKENTVHENIESTVSYIVAVMSIAFGYLLTVAPAVASIGGLVLLALRLYVDGKRAVRTWRGHE